MEPNGAFSMLIHPIPFANISVVGAPFAKFLYSWQSFFALSVHIKVASLQAAQLSLHFSGKAEKSVVLHLHEGTH